MTKLGFRSLALLFVLGMAGSAWLLADALPHAHDELRCDDWLAQPREGSFRLVDCRIEVTQASTTAGVHTHLAAAPGGPTVAVFSSDPDVAARVSRLQREDVRTRIRTVERYQRELVLTRTIEGHAIRDGYGADYILRENQPSSFGIALGIVAGIVFALALAWLVLLQRRWTRRSKAAYHAHSGTTEPTVF